MYLTIQAEQTDSLHRLTSKAVHLAVVTSIPVKFALKSITVTVHKGDTIRDVVERWESVNRQLTPTPVQ